MGDETMNVVVAGYPDIGAARHDFDALIDRVKDKAVASDGVILVAKDDDGNVTLSETGDHLGRRGAGWGAGVGAVVGLLAPPLLASVAIGAAGGGVVGKFAGHKLSSEIQDKIGEALPRGRAGIIGVFPERDRLAVEQVLAGSPMRSVVAMEKGGLRELQGSLAEAMGKFSPDRTVLPIPDRSFGGTIGRTLEASVADWSIVPGPKAPEGAPNVLVVLVDDAGFGQASTFGGPVPTPELDKLAAQGLRYNRFHTTAICGPSRACLSPVAIITIAALAFSPSGRRVSPATTT